MTTELVIHFAAGQSNPFLPSLRLAVGWMVSPHRNEAASVFLCCLSRLLISSTRFWRCQLQHHYGFVPRIKTLSCRHSDPDETKQPACQRKRLRDPVHLLLVVTSTMHKCISLLAIIVSADKGDCQAQIARSSLLSCRVCCCSREQGAPLARQPYQH